jgi:hypothetical protein
LKKKFIDWIEKAKFKISLKNTIENNNLSLLYLKKIIEISKGSGRLDPSKAPFEYQRFGKNIMEFESKTYKLISKVPLKSIKYIKMDSYGYHIWEVDLNEFQSVYTNKNIFNDFINNELIPVYKMLIKSNDANFNYPLIKYELTLLTIKNTLEECVQINDCVTEEISQASIELLREFIVLLINVYKEKEELHSLKTNSANKSLLERLEFEKEFQKRYLKP